MPSTSIALFWLIRALAVELTGSRAIWTMETSHSAGPDTFVLIVSICLPIGDASDWQAWSWLPVLFSQEDIDRIAESLS